VGLAAGWRSGTRATTAGGSRAGATACTSAPPRGTSACRERSSSA